MAIFIARAPASLEPEEYAIGFNIETWDFSIYRNEQPVAVLGLDTSDALIHQLKKSFASAAPGKLSSDTNAD